MIPPRLLMLFFGLAMVLGPITAAHAQDNEFYHPFRGKKLSDDLIMFNDKTGQFFRAEAEGLRITLPKVRENFQSVGLRTKFPLKGDFEVTTAFEILEAEEPEDGFGVGVSMRVEKVDSQEAATIARLVRAKGAQIVFWDRSFQDEGGKLKFEGTPKPCTEKNLRLRLKRTGAALQYSWAPGEEGDDFKVIHTAEKFGVEDLKQVALSAATGKKFCKLDVRIFDFRVRSSGPLPAAAKKKPPPPAEVKGDPPAPAPNVAASEQAPSRSWLMVGLLIGGTLIVIFVVAVVVAIFVFRRGPAAPPAEKPARKGKR